MWALILVVLVIVFFTKSKGVSIGEWLRSLDFIIRVGIFTGIVGALLHIITIPFSTTSYGGEATSGPLMGVVGLIASLFIIVSFLCFIYVFIKWLIAFLFGSNSKQ